LLKYWRRGKPSPKLSVSVLFNEPKLLKFYATDGNEIEPLGFSALQRAEIAEISCARAAMSASGCFSALQRAEIAEILNDGSYPSAEDWFQCSSTSRNC